MPSPREIAAVHEAGHLVALLAFRGIPKEVSVGDAGGGHVLIEDSRCLSAHQKMIMAMAGAAACEVLLGMDECSSAEDDELAREGFQDLFASTDRMKAMNAVRREVSQLVFKHEDAIKQVANVLMRKDRLTRDEICEMTWKKGTAMRAFAGVIRRPQRPERETFMIPRDDRSLSTRRRYMVPQDIMRICEEECGRG